MKAAITELIQHAPTLLLKEYFVNQSFSKEIDWTSDNDEIFFSLIKAIDKMTDHEQESLIIESERIYLMTNELGQAALKSLIHENEELLQMKSSYYRALWIFMHDNVSFVHAEKIYYADRYLKDGILDGYIAPKNINITHDPKQILLFEEEVSKFFMEAEDQKIEIFNRYIVNNIGKIVKVFQVLIHLRGMPELHTELENENDTKFLTTKISYPVENISITYAPSEGQVDISFKGDESKKEIVYIFAKTLLRSSESDAVTLKQYKIEKLLKPYEFITDPEDNIETVKIMAITFKSLIDDNSITIECSPKEKRSINDVVYSWFKENDLLHNRADFMPVQATLFIHLYSDRLTKRKEILSVKITIPHGCEISNKNIQELFIVEKYLQRWGLIEEV